MGDFALAQNELFYSLLQVSWRATVIAALVLLVQWCFRAQLSPGWRHGLWLLVLARLACPSLPPSALSVFNLLRSPPTPLGWSNPDHRASTGHSILSHAKAGAGCDQSPSPPRSARTSNSPTVRLKLPETPAAVDALPLTPVRASNPAARPSAGAWKERLLVLLPWCWLAGVLVLGMRLAWQSVRFARRLRSATAIQSSTLLEVLRECALRMKLRRLPRVIETGEVRSPALYGLVRPRLLLPQGLVESFSRRELRHVLLHEFGHIKRQDMAVHWLTTVFQTLHWFNPLLWLAFDRMRADRELACDALALARADEGENKSYGETIIKILSNLSRPSAAPGLVGILENRQQLKSRIRMIARFQRAPSWPALAVCVFAVLMAVALTDAQTQDKTEKIPSPGRQRIQRRLETIAFDNVLYDNVSLSEVVRDVRERARQRDPDQRGINILINPKLPSVQPTLGTSPLLSLNDVPIRLRLQNVRLWDVLDAVCKVANPPLQYTVEDYGVVFLAGPSDPHLFTRTFRVNPDTFMVGLAAVVTTPATAQTPDGAPKPRVIDLIRNFFIAAGVDFTTNTIAIGPGGVPGPAAKALFFNDRTGLLLVRATTEELDTIEKALQVLNTAPPQVTIEAKLVEISREDGHALGFDWFLGNRSFHSEKADLSTAPALNGILTDPQFRVVQRALEQRTDVSVVSAPRVTTVSGRQARIEMATLGLSLDILPRVLADGSSVQVDVEFAIKPDRLEGEPPPEDTTPSANPQDPKNTLRVTTRAIVWDGQTMVLGPFPQTQATRAGGEPADSKPKNNIILFITPTLIDPAGNRVHAGRGASLPYHP